MRENIPYIHNYCDRWCERCTFTSRCAVYEMEASYSEGEKDMHNEAFWNRLSENFKTSMQMLIEGGKKHGFDFDKIPEEEMKQAALEMEEVDALTDADPLIRMVDEYTDKMHCLLDDTEYWKSIAGAYVVKTELEIGDPEDTITELQTLTDCREVISWDHFFINAKFRRAVSGRLESWFDASDLQSDSNGSAKIAMIGVERSLQALAAIYEYTKDEDRLLPLLSLLTQIEKMAKDKFPRAIDFVRPGFDTEAVTYV